MTLGEHQDCLESPYFNLLHPSDKVILTTLDKLIVLHSILGRIRDFLYKITPN